MLVQSFIERILRPLVGIKSWDYIVLWKLSNDHRFIEWIKCCCAGSDENIKNGGEDTIFESCSSGTNHCRDIMFPHPRTKPCDLLDQLPTSIILDSGVHAQTLLLNQATWINYSHNSDSSLSEETIGTRVLVPVSLGLVELFVTKQVPEDQNVMDFIRSQCNNLFLEQQQQHDSFTHHPDPNTNFPLHQFGNNYTTPETNNNSNFTAYNDSGIFTPSIENGFQDIETSNTRKNNNSSSRGGRWAPDDQLNDGSSFICENNMSMRSDESDPNEDEDDAKYRRRTGKGPQSKNLMAERKRRKKLNDRLYSLRALVPNISKLAKSAILGDAIDYVNKLKKQVEELQIELEEHSENEDNASKTGNEDNKNNVDIHPSTTIHKEEPLDNTINDNKVQQMEPQVEVFQIDGNEFFVKVFCEHICGGFVRLMEALNSLGLEVTNVNTTRHTCLVSSIFKVERKNDETVQVDDVKESLLELTRNPSTNNRSNVHLVHNAIDMQHDYRIHNQYSCQHDLQH